MSVQQAAGGEIRVGFRQAAGMLWPYVQSRFLAQVKVVALMITCLIVFQALVLGIPVAQAALIAAGLPPVIVCLTFFMSSVPEPMNEAAFSHRKTALPPFPSSTTGRRLSASPRPWKGPGPSMRSPVGFCTMFGFEGLYLPGKRLISERGARPSGGTAIGNESQNPRYRNQFPSIAG